ncbi:MAG: PKD domain-containing protein, partial [Bacteroidales bacterium]|nr:PKD domain-containing protein [Bacteroidales bacterium]
MYLFTNDTACISSTVIDGSENGRVINAPVSYVSIIGFTITNGKISSGEGAVFYCEDYCFISNNIIRGNKIEGPQILASGGGIYTENYSVVQFNEIKDNHIISDYNIKTIGELENITEFAEIKGECRGGGLAGGNYCIVNNNIVINNQVYAHGESTTAMGGGIFIEDSCLIKDNIISLNFAKSSSIGLSNSTYSAYTYGGGICLGASTINGCLVTENETFASASSMYGIIFSGSYGGGVCFNTDYNELARIKNCIISGNYCYISDIGYYNIKGGGIWGRGKIYNSTIINNGLEDVSYANGSGIGGTFQIFNSLVYFNIPSQSNIMANCTAEYSNIQGGANGQGNIDINPQLDAYSLSPVSPCIDAGNPDTIGLNLPLTDYFGNPRISDGNLDSTQRIDMGAHEFPCYINADFAVDLKFGPAPLLVQFNDSSEVFNTQIDHWEWDFNIDGQIDSNDPDPSFIYDTTGIYSVHFLVGDTSGYISDSILKNDVIVVYRFVADFYADTTFSPVPATIQFYDLSGIEYAKIDSWQWDFNGDGITDSEEQNPEFTYQEEGFWDVTLIIQDTSGFIFDTLTKEGYIETYVSDINENSEKTGVLQVFPNPFGQQLIISCEGIQGPFSVFISDINGI